MPKDVAAPAVINGKALFESSVSALARFSVNAKVATDAAVNFIKLRLVSLGILLPPVSLLVFHLFLLDYFQ